MEWGLWSKVLTPRRKSSVASNEMRKRGAKPFSSRTILLFLGMWLAASACSQTASNGMTTIPREAFPDPVVHAAAQGIADKDFAAQLSAAAADGKLDYVGPDGDTLLLVAVMANNRDAVQMLLKLGANPDVPLARAPLGVAASVASFEIVEALVNAGADVNGRVESEPAIWRAALSNRRDVVQLLVQRGAAIDAANDDGETPAIAAAQAGHFTMAGTLVASGASLFAVPSSGMTLGFWAHRSRLSSDSDEGRARDRLVQALKDRGHPWPPPGPDEVLAMKAVGQWPPRQ